MYAKAIQLIQRQADADLCDTFQSWAKKVQCNPAGQLCPDANDIRTLLAEWQCIERTAHKAALATDNLFHRTLIRDTRREAAERAYEAKMDAITKAEAMGRARRLIDDSFKA